ncbi:MAG: hypothetical protein U0Z44_16560 [Kouleothrix sp.]
MADRTAWSATMFDMEEVIDYWVDQVAISPEQAAQLDRLPQLSSVPPTWRCFRNGASAQPFHLPDGRPIDLGQVVRYVFGRTGNWFADLSCDELAEMSAGSGIDWCSDDLIAIAADQTAARGWFEHYHALNALVTAEPTVPVPWSLPCSRLPRHSSPPPLQDRRSSILQGCKINPNGPKPFHHEHRRRHL